MKRHNARHTSANELPIDNIREIHVCERNGIGSYNLVKRAKDHHTQMHSFEPSCSNSGHD